MDLKPYDVAVGGFFQGRNQAYLEKQRTQKDMLFQKQQQEEEAMKQHLTGVLSDELKVPAERLSGLSKDDLINVGKMHIDKKKVEATAKQKELDDTFKMADFVIKSAKETSGPTQKLLLNKGLPSVIKSFQKHGSFKDINVEELQTLISSSEEKTVGTLVKELNVINKSIIDGLITKTEGEKLAADAYANFIDEAKDSSKMKIATSEMDNFRKKLEPKPEPAEPMSVAALTQRALRGDGEAQAILDRMQSRDIQIVSAKSEAAVGAKLGTIDIAGTAQAVLDGRETIENVKNTFGVPIQETIRKEVLKQDPAFNFNQPRAASKAIASSVAQQQRNRGMMGSFVKNINGQVDKLERISQNIVKRIGIRALDLPRRELLTRFVGSGQEQVLAAYMKEVSAEIAKLAQGSAASIAQLPESNRIEWEKIHDVNLSFRELLIVLNGTREMANIRLKSVDDEIKETMGRLGNVRQSRDEQAPSAPQSAGKTIVKKFVSPSTGKTKYVYSDGTEEIK